MINATTGASSGSGLANQRQTIAENFDTFLQLLITQLKHQNPLEPMDTNEFTAQLVQFTSVEQQLKTNEFLETMMKSSQSELNMHAVNYVGKVVTASGASTDLVDGKAAWLYRIDHPAENTTVTIKDDRGNTVYTDKLSLKAGTDQIVWNGLTSAGEKLTQGRFTITIDARDANGAYVPVTTEMMGKVESVDVSGPEPYLMIAGLRIPLSAVTSVGNEMPEGDDGEDPVVPPTDPDD